MATILSRKTWTSTKAGGAAMSMSRSRGVVVHYPAAGKDIGVLTLAQEASRLRGWRNYHVSGRGWADLGYNYAIGQSGRIHTGRGLRVGAHASGHNSTTVGVLFIVGDNEKLTKAAKRAFKALRAYLRKKGVGSGVWGHQQMSGASTRCPGPYIMADVRDGSLKAGTGGGAAKPGGSGGGSSTYSVVGKNEALGLYDKDGAGRTRVKDWQTDALGYKGKKADGFFGPDTESDTKALQKQIGLTGKQVDGMVGPTTEKAWKAAGKPKLGKSGGSSKPKAPAPKKSAPKFPWPKDHWAGQESSNPKNHSGYWKRDREHIKTIQRAVGASVDGSYGPETARKVKAYQRKHGLADDGLFGEKSWAKL